MLAHPTCGRHDDAVDRARSRLGRLTDAEAVLAAMAELDAVGRDTFLDRYGFGRATQYVLVHDGHEHDSKAIVGAALAHQPGVGEALEASAFSGGLAGAVAQLRRLGFVVERRLR